jgi:outer membrane receptor protein involved in Fe transport
MNMNSRTLAPWLLLLTLTVVLRPSAHSAQPASAVPAAPAAPPPETVMLSPFEVVGDANDTYEATNTTALTGTNTPLSKAPLDARVITNTMIAELGGGDVFKMLSDFGGLGAMIFGAGSEDQRGMQPGDAAQPAGLTSRGFAISEPRRDGFLRSSTSMFNAFDVESAEVIAGSNNLLYGSGDAGGVVVINSKRARVGQNAFKYSLGWDSEGSWSHKVDLNASTRKFALRVNGLLGDERYYRPVLGLHQEGLQLAATLRPFRWLNVFADYRHYTRAAIIAQSATVRAPTDLRLSNGLLLDNQVTRYITGYGGVELTDHVITLASQDSVFGAWQRQHWTNQAKSVTVDLTPARDLAFQFRYGHDSRLNFTQAPTSGVIFHPYATGNLLVDANGAPRREWAFNSSLQPIKTHSGARGYKLTAAGRRDLGRWGDHRLNAFFSDQESWTIGGDGYRFYELDASGNVIQNPANIRGTEAGRNLLPAAWWPAFSRTLLGGIKWPSDLALHPNGRTYRLQPQRYAGAVPATAGNPLGLSGAIDAATGQPSGSYFIDDVTERSRGFSFSSSFWQGRIETMAGFRFETADTLRVTTNVQRGPIDYHSRTLGAVVDTPLPGLRVYGSYATNAKINFTSDTDLYNNPLPLGSGETREAGLKLSLWDHRVSGNLTYYQTTGRNFVGSLGVLRNLIDPDGINGRNGGASFLYDKVSDGLSAGLSMRPLKPWQISISFTQANGSERSDVNAPVFYNDEFNTTTVGGQTVVAIKNAATGALSPLLVPSDPRAPGGAQVPLSLAMMKDRASPYFATLDPDSGQILNAQTLGLRTPGVGTDRSGLPISGHQLGFTPPAGTLIVRRAGEVTTGYAENSFSIINRFQVTDGRLRGLVFGLSTIYQEGFRAYMYTDAADAGKRKIFYYPDKFLNNAFAVYPFKIGRRLQCSVQLNISNLFDKQEVLTLRRNTTGEIRYFAHQYTPRGFALTTNLGF